MATTSHVLSTSGSCTPRLHPVPSDNMEPTVRRGDFLLVVPVEGYCGEGIYLLADPIGGLVPYRVTADLVGGVEVSSDSGRHGRYPMSLAAFEAAVAAKTIATVNVIDLVLALSAMSSRSNRGGPSDAPAFPAEPAELSAQMTLLAHDLNIETSPARVARYAVAAPLLDADVRSDTPHVRALRVLDALGETLAGIVIIAGGAIATGLATLL